MYNLDIKLGNVDFDFDNGEDSDFEGGGVHSLLPRASLDSVEDGDRDEDDNAHSPAQELPMSQKAS